MKIEIEEFKAALNFTNKIKSFAEDLTNKMINQGMTPKEAIRVNPKELENIYAQAYRYYNTGKYSEAAHLFQFLILLNPMDPKYLLGLAACLHLLKQYANAIQSYTLCSVLDPKDPIPYYHISDCFIKTKDPISAMVSLELAVEKAGNREEFAKLKERAVLGLEGLKEQIKSNPLKNESALEDSEKPSL